MNLALQTMLASSFGAAVQEIIYWYNLRHSLNEQKYRELIGSVGYWFALSAMVLGTGLAAYFWFAGDKWPTSKEAMTFGIALPLLVKQIGSAASSGVRFGPEKPLISYFRGY
ncbi:hypothetical protein [Novosphingobium sp. TCA1]|uniref:hypothetical protein n=1 Tax=Novosphingobium sp. TCA1 TaxID=2682474 RepID=UPI0013057A0A|nr:hypothetical protein [Novosphingobium sp. TCA1]GFE77562.1 hypothetical protein NTCA1_52110 [Novosphingobium sp. TCA1]